MSRAFIALGSNLQDPALQVKQALAELDQLPDTHIVIRSSLYRTAPLDHHHRQQNDQPEFINAVAEISTELSPHLLLTSLLGIENQHGRERPFPNAPRVLDLDMLLYDTLIMNDASLTLPHPRMHERSFVLAPLAEIAPTLEIPGKGTVIKLLHTCPDQNVRRFES